MNLADIQTRNAALEATIASLRFHLAEARSTDNLFDLIRICDDALMIEHADTELQRRDRKWIAEYERMAAKLKEYGVAWSPQ